MSRRGLPSAEVRHRPPRAAPLRSPGRLPSDILLRPQCPSLRNKNGWGEPPAGGLCELRQGRQLLTTFLDRAKRSARSGEHGMLADANLRFAQLVGKTLPTACAFSRAFLIPVFTIYSCSILLYFCLKKILLIGKDTSTHDTTSGLIFNFCLTLSMEKFMMEPIIIFSLWLTGYCVYHTVKDIASDLRQHRKEPCFFQIMEGVKVSRK